MLIFFNVLDGLFYNLLCAKQSNLTEEYTNKMDPGNTTP